MNSKDNKGLTLVMLIITILVMVILAGIAISMATGNDGVVKKAENVSNSNKLEEDKEKLEMTIIKILEKKTVITKDDLSSLSESGHGWSIIEKRRKY